MDLFYICFCSFDYNRGGPGPVLCLYGIGATCISALKQYAVTYSRDRIQLKLWMILFLGNAIDIASTWFAFSLGCDDLNPVMNYLFVKNGMAGLILFKSFWLFVLLIFSRQIEGWKLGLVMASCFFYYDLALFHFYQITSIVVCLYIPVL
jgi:hypothetical protein